MERDTILGITEMQLDPRPQLTPIWTLHSNTFVAPAVDRSVSWSPIGSVAAVEVVPSAGAEAVNLARFLGIQILGARTD